jgi:outer membrane protein
VSIQNESIAWGNIFPAINIEGHLSTTYADDGSREGTFYSNSLVGTIRQVIFDYGVFSAISQAEYQSRRAQKQFMAQKQNLMLSVATTYMDVLLAEDQLRFAKANVKSLKNLKKVKARYEAGLATIADLKLAKAQLYNVKAEKEQNQNKLETSYYQLYLLTGEITRNLAVLKSGQKYQQTEKSLKQWVQIAKKHNYQLQAQKASKQAAREAISVASSNFLPSVSLVAGYTMQNFSGSSEGMLASNVFNEHIRSGSLRLNVSWNIFSGGRDFAERYQAAYAYERAKYQTVQTQRDIVRKTTNDFLAVNEQVKRVQALKQAVNASQTAYKQFKNRYKVGTADITEVLDQLKQLFEKKSRLAEAKYDYIKAVLRLKLNAGTLSKKDLVFFNQWLKSMPS